MPPRQESPLFQWSAMWERPINSKTIYKHIGKLACQKCISKQYVCTLARLILTRRFNMHRYSARSVEKEVLDRQPRKTF